MAFDFDLFVLGAGSGGVRAARVAAGFGARVAIAERGPLGGTCVNVGCVPKKMLVYGASYADDFEHAAHYGWTTGAPSFDWPRLIANKDREIARLNVAYRALLEQAGALIVLGNASIVDPHTVEVDGQRYSAAHILIATGCAAERPDIPGKAYAITSDDVFHLPHLPRRVLVAGGGYIAVEFATIFHGMGAQVTLLHRGDLFLRGFDDGIRTHLRDQFRLAGLDMRFDCEIARIDRRGDGTLAVTLADDTVIATDCVLFATGRRPRLDRLGLERTRVARDARGYIEVDAHYRTAEPSIHAIGDVIGRVQLTPVALAEGMAVARHLFRPEAFRPVDYTHIPTAVFSLPNVGTVGLTETQARARGETRVYETHFKPLKLTLTASLQKTYMKLVVDAQTDRVLGCHMVGPDAGEIVQGLAVALNAGATKRVFDETLGIHPTTAEEFVTMREPRA